MKKIICLLVSLMMVVSAFSYTYKYNGKIYTEEEFNNTFASEMDKIEEDWQNGLIEIIPSEKEALMKELTSLNLDITVYQIMISKKHKEGLSQSDVEWLNTHDIHKIYERTIEVKERLEELREEE